MSITYGGLTFAEYGGGNPVTTPGFSSAISAGDLIVVFGFAKNGAPDGFIGSDLPYDSAGNTYSRVPSTFYPAWDNDSGDSYLITAYYCSNAKAVASGMTVSLSFGLGYSYACIYAIRYTGLTNAVLDLWTYSASDVPSIPVSFTPTGANELCVWLCNTDIPGGGFTQGSGYTRRVFSTYLSNYIQDNTATAAGSQTFGFTPTGTPDEGSGFLACVFKNGIIATALPNIVRGQVPNVSSVGLPVTPKGVYLRSSINKGVTPNAPLAGLPFAPSGSFVSSPIVIGERARAPLGARPSTYEGASSPYIIHTAQPTIGRPALAPEAPKPRILAGFIQSVPAIPYWMQWAAGGPPPYWEYTEEEYIPNAQFNLYEQAIADRRLKQIFEQALEDDHSFNFTEPNFDIKPEIIPRGTSKATNVNNNLHSKAQSTFKGDKPLTLIQQNIAIKNIVVEKNSILVETAKFVGAIVLATVITVHIVQPKNNYREIKMPRKRRAKRLRGS